MDQHSNDNSPNVIRVDEAGLAALRAGAPDAATYATMRAETIRKQYRPSLARFVRQRVAMAWSFVRALWSLVAQRRLTDAQYEARIVQCLTCDALKAPRGTTEPVGFCGACGCGTGRLAQLTIKANMPAAKCPKNRWPVKGKRSTESPTPLEVSATKRTLQRTDSTDSPTPIQS